MESQLDIMKNKWQLMGIESCFPQVHHFSSEKFATKPSGLDGFYNWCVLREIKEENIQTLQRALEVVSLYEKNKDIQRAIRLAWEKYPVCKR